MVETVKDWLCCLAVSLAVGDAARHQVGSLWCRMTPFERRVFIFRLRSHIDDYADRLDRQRAFAKALGEDTEDLEANYSRKD